MDLLSPENLNTIAEEAIFNRFIGLYDLVAVMAAEDNYVDIMPKLWKLFKCYNAKEGEIEADLCTMRIARWTVMLQLWGGFLTNSTLVRHLNLYYEDPVTAELRRCSSHQLRGQPYLIKLEDLKDYIKDIERACKMIFPLPKRLFSEEQEQKKEVTNKKNFFRKEGDFWDVSFDGVMVSQLRHLIGMDYIKYLLENPNRPVASLAFIRTPPTSKEASQLGKMHEGQLEEVGLTESASLGFKGDISKETKENYKRRIQELEEIINDAESLGEEVSKAQKDKKELIKQLKTFRDKSIDKPRTSVSNAITRAINRIRTYHPSLAEHLKKNVHLGYSCIYTPSTDPNWNK